MQQMNLWMNRRTDGKTLETKRVGLSAGNKERAGFLIKNLKTQSYAGWFCYKEYTK